MLCFYGCESRDGSTQDGAKNTGGGKLHVGTTIFPLADWTRNVGGDRVEVTTLLPAGRSPHTFDPSPADGRSVAKAALFLKAGLKMDDWSDRLQASAKG